MVLTPSTMVELGTRAPEFELPEVGGGKVSSPDFSDKAALLVMFISQHCPYVQHVRHELARLGRDYADSRLGIVAISSNEIAGYPDDSPENLDRMRREAGFTFPVCFDETQDVAKAFRASCTPDFFLFDRNRILVYRGQLDDSRPGNRIPVTGKDLRAAIDAVLKGEPVTTNQKASIGCNIKWKKGNEPDYF
jgi:peroxiredoxin